MDFTEKVYTFKNIPNKRDYVKNRIKKIYDNIDDKKINKILDSIKIQFRDQEEKGAANHKTKKIFLTFREIKRNNIKNEKDLIKYLESPKSIITHETIHIFQNVFESFPHNQYVKKDNDGKQKIEYLKYVGDPGEIQSRIEQIIELFKFGFGKDEIVNLLYSRKHNDPELWRELVDKAEDIKKKFGSSKLPLDEEENDDRQQDRANDYWVRNKQDRGNNYEKDYMSSGHLDSDYITITKN